jgi:hypothetical protein
VYSILRTNAIGWVKYRARNVARFMSAFALFKLPYKSIISKYPLVYDVVRLRRRYEALDYNLS